MTSLISRHCLAFAAASALCLLAASASANMPAPLKAAYGNYVRVVRDGRILYCNRDKQPGSHIIRETCLLPTEARDRENHRQYWDPQFENSAYPNGAVNQQVPINPTPTRSR